MRLPDRAPQLLRVALCAVAAFVVGNQLLLLADQAVVGTDFQPLRHAAQALRAGQSVYTDPGFVYPPTAAVVLGPTSLGSEMAAFRCWVVLSMAALALAGVLVSRAAGPRWRASVAAASVIVLIGSCAGSDSLFLGNLSLMLVPAAVGVVMPSTDVAGRADARCWRSHC